MRYFLDTEFNGFGGALISLALVPEYGDQEFYAVVRLEEPPHGWVERNVMPYLGCVPPGIDAAPISRLEAANEIARYLAADSEPMIIADWPDDIAYLCSLLVTGPGQIAAVGSIRFEFLSSPGFSTAKNSHVPHNALHDARALRSFVLSPDN
jgi:3' exoribonuclease, RNase T-like